MERNEELQKYIDEQNNRMIALSQEKTFLAKQAEDLEKSHKMLMIQ